MIFDIEVNHRIIQAEKGETILSALNRAGVTVPTLCSMKDLSPTGACRMCVVEVEGKPGLVPSCSYPVEEWMHIRTHSPRVIRARKLLVELLLSNHPDDCLYCERNGNCELQSMAEELQVRERRIPGARMHYKLDKSSPGIVREPSKCILCGRCVRVCEEQQAVSSIDFLHRGSQTIVGTAFNKDLNFSSCIQCGQCIVACPTAALTEKVQFPDLEQYLHDPSRKVVVQYSPVVASAIAGEFGIKNGKQVQGITEAVLRKLGFVHVFDSSFGTDLQIVELAHELSLRLKEDKDLPMFSSCCPSWVKFAEQFYPEFLSLLSTSKSGQQITGSLIKSYLAEMTQVSPSSLFSVSIMPCISRKFESQRADMTQKGVSDIDMVLTTRELIRMIRLYGLNMQQIEPEKPEEMLSVSSSAGKITGASGGLTEALIRTLHFIETGKELRDFNALRLRGNKDKKEIRLKIGEREVGFVVLNGLGGVRSLLEEIHSGRKDIHFVEVMACKGGCIAGGGQPIGSHENDIKMRMKSIFEADERETLRASHKNPRLNELFNSWLGEPYGEKCRKLLHTSFSKRDVML